MRGAAQQEIEDQHGEMVSLVSNYLPNAIVVTVVTISDEQGGQLVLCDPKFDKTLVAERLRICANCLEAEA